MSQKNTQLYEYNIKSIPNPEGFTLNMFKTNYKSEPFQVKSLLMIFKGHLMDQSDA